MIRNLYKIVFLFLSFQIFGQVYPVQITPIFNTPYSSRISDYATSMDVKMQLLINPSDISITNRQVRLKMYLQGNNINAQSVDYVNGINPIYINGGELLTLTNLDLAALFRLENLQGITPVQYANALPEGMYNVCFELYDFATNQRISQKSCAYLYLMLNDPPLLNTPAKNESIAVSDFPNILFTWTPRQLNATNVSYEFEIKEILDPTIDPQIGFLTSPTLYDETLYSTALLYDSSKPNLLAGKRYAWRVRAMSTSGLSLNNVFKNDGYSEIHHFTYASNCPAPTFILSEALSARSVRISWQGDNSHTKYHLQYKKANVSRAEWFEVYTMNTQTTLTDLEAGVTYEFRVGGSCEPAVLGNRASFTYSGINNFTLPAVGTTSSSFTCGLNPAVAIANQTPITNLIVTETFTAGDFPVKILELTGNNPYNGKGYIIVPYLADTKIAVVFNNITINTNYQLINGIVETSYNPQAPNINDLEDLTGGNNGVIITQTISFVITTVTTNPNGDIIVSGANGEQIAIPGGSNTVITGTTATGGTGSIYNVDSQGNVTGPFMPAPGGATTPQNTDGVATNGQTTQFAAQGLTIAFEPTTATKYSWDIVPDTAPTYIKDKYAKIGSAYLPYKAVVNGQSDVLKTKITLADATIVLDSIVFKTQHGVLLDKVKQGNDYMLTLKGTQTYGEEEVQAVIKQGGKYKVAGAFRLVHVSEKTLNITLVPLNNTTSIPNNAIRNLQTNYEKAGVKLTIKTAPVLMYDGEADAKITTSDSGLFDYYTDEEKSINAKIKALSDYNNKSYYLIYSNLPSDKGIEGFMALGGQFGYVFPNASSKTASHELGHGAFVLQHPFINAADKGKTSFLMDYGTGTQLWHNDWAQINNPALKFYGFQGDSQGELAGRIWFTPDWEAFSFDNSKTIASLSGYPKGTVPGIYFNNISYKYIDGKYKNDKNEPLHIKKEFVDNNYAISLYALENDLCNVKVYKARYSYALQNKTNINYSDIDNVSISTTFTCPANVEEFVTIVKNDNTSTVPLFLTELKEAYDKFIAFYQNCSQQQWKPGKSPGIVPKCFWENSITNEDDFYEYNDISYTSGIVDGGYAEVKGIIDVADLILSGKIEEKINDITYAYTRAYFFCKKQDIAYDKKEYKALLEKLSKLESTPGIWSWMQQKYYEPDLKDLAQEIKKCEDANQLRKEIADGLKDFKESIDSYQEIKKLVNNVSNKLKKYYDLVTSKENVGRYEAGRLVVPVASTVIPIVGQIGKIGKTKAVLKGISELSEAQVDDLVEEIIVVGRREGILQGTVNELATLFAGARQRAIAKFGKEAEELIYIKFNKDGGAAAEILDHYGEDGLNALKKVALIDDAAKELVKGKTVYRAVNETSYNFNKLKTQGLIDASPTDYPTYISLDYFEDANIIQQKLQLPKKPTWVAEFNGDQILSDVRIPNGKYLNAEYKEVLCRSFPEINGVKLEGGGSQFISNSAIKVKRLINLETKEVINFNP
ncbi:hypothetical protein NO004_510010 [Flavobacterium psychrophilum]|uniref:fibronectin type III domain-containing protein n=1 Tax=Flavobacterium psychrophilum TaxID=96345 RepID=UPI000B7C1543|nr:fibronectin type III domain-containing protein [Flavobacterium psychrophilum]SNB29069.1 hypothetical protein NO004_510010 [Flavobacterium psychrophilum]